MERRLTLFPISGIVIANMIGAGIFTTSGLLMGALHDPVLMLLLWLVGGFVAFCGAMCYAELGAAMPEAGGEYAFLSRMFHPLLGFLSGWVSLIAGFSAPIAASAIGCSAYLIRAFPGIPSAIPGPSGDLWAGPLLSLIVIALFTAVHMRGITFGSRVQNVLTILKVALIGGLVTAGFAAGNGDWSRLTSGPGFSASGGNLQTFGLSLMWIMFAYSGWNAATYIGSEIRDPSTNLPRSLLLATGIVTALYMALNVFYVYAIDPASMEGVISVGGLAVGMALGRGMEGFASTLIAFALFSSLSAYVLLGPRVYYAMAKDGVFFRSLAVVSVASHAPSRAILLQGAISSLLVLTGSFDQILTYMGFSLGIFPILAVASLVRLRRWRKSALRLPGYPGPLLVYLIAGTVMLVLSALERPWESTLAIGTVAAGVPVYLLFRKRSP